MKSFTARREKFREILAGNRLVHPGSLYDPISARIAQDIGYEIGLLGGSAASLAILGAPDITLITLSELVEQCRRICRACDLPLLVDADHGYGNALNVARSIEDLEAVGVAAITIEDIMQPRPYGPRHKVPISIDEMLGKLRAAVGARLDPSLVLVGRLTGLRSVGLEDTLKRIKLCEETGVDATMVLQPKTREELEAICSTAKLPLIVTGVSTGALGTMDELAKLGVKISPQGHVPPLAATYAIKVALQAVYDGISPSKVPNIADKELMAKFIRKADYDRWIKEFLGGD